MKKPFKKVREFSAHSEKVNCARLARYSGGMILATGGEDMLVIPENLRLYLESDEIVQASRRMTQDDNSQMPLFLGGRLAFEGDPNMVFNQGGGGYTLNKAALKTLFIEQKLQSTETQNE